MDVIELDWHGQTTRGQAIRGMARLSPAKGIVLSAMAYAPATEWDVAKPELMRVIDSVRVAD